MLPAIPPTPPLISLCTYTMANTGTTGTPFLPSPASSLYLPTAASPGLPRMRTLASTSETGLTDTVLPCGHRSSLYTCLEEQGGGGRQDLDPDGKPAAILTTHVAVHRLHIHLSLGSIH